MSRVLIIDSQTPVGHEVGKLLTTAGLSVEYAAGHIDALHRLRCRMFSVIITSADGVIEEALALIQEMRLIRPNLKCIVLAPRSTPDEVIAAMRARVFGWFTPPFDAHAIFTVALDAATRGGSNEDVEILSA